MQAGTRGGRIAAFVIEWAAMQHDLERDDLSVEDYIEWSRAPRRSCYRRSAEYRELFPDVPVNELAAQLNRLVDDAESRPTLTTALAL